MSRFIDDEACLSGSGSEDEEEDEYDTNDGFVVSDSEEIVEYRGRGKKVKLTPEEYNLDDDDYDIMEEVLGSQFVEKSKKKRRTKRLDPESDDNESNEESMPVSKKSQKRGKFVESDDDKENTPSVTKDLFRATPNATPKAIQKATTKATSKAASNATPKATETPKSSAAETPKAGGKFVYPKLPSDNKFIPLQVAEKKSAGKEQWSFLMRK